nr:hypothetical protein FVER53263_20005 [Fusarium verticillioides]
MAVRLAKASDLAATWRIAFRSFSLSPWNAFYRPFASAYPQEALGDQSKLFTVVEIQTEAQDAKQTAVLILIEPASSSAPQKAQFKGEASHTTVATSTKRSQLTLPTMGIWVVTWSSTAWQSNPTTSTKATGLCFVSAASKLGMKLYKYLGLACIAKVSLTDDRTGENANVDFWVQEWNVKDN